MEKSNKKDNQFSPEDIIIALTEITKENGILTKKISKNKDGKVFKDSSDCVLIRGTGEVKTIFFSELPGLLSSLDKDKAIVHGIPKNEQLIKFQVFSDRQYSRLEDTTEIITRTKKHFQFSTQTNHLLMFDYDPAEETPPLTLEQLTQAINGILPGFDNAAKVITHSTSSCINDNSGIEVTKPSAGYHLYFAVPAGTDVDRFKEIFKTKAWLNDFGFIKISKSGAMLKRNRLFDEQVFSPERLDFVAGAVIPKGWTQNRPEPQFIDGTVFDPASLDELTEDEQNQAAQLMEQAKEDLRPEADKTTKKYIKTTAQSLAKNTGKDLAYCEDIMTKARMNSDLYDDFPIYFDAGKGRKTNVNSILKDMKKYDGLSCADPLEPAGTQTKAIFISNQGKAPGKNKPMIHSFAHGPHSFFLKAKPPEIAQAVAIVEAAISLSADTDDAGAIYTDEVLAAARLLKEKGKSEYQKIRGRIKADKQASVTEWEKALKAADGGKPEDDNPHITICENFVEGLKKKALKVVGCEGSFWQYKTNGDGLYTELEMAKAGQHIGKENRHEKKCQKGADYKSIASLSYVAVGDRTFFSDARHGLPGKTQFYSISSDFKVSPVAYSPDLRQRWKLPVDPSQWYDELKAPLFREYLEHTFRDDILQELAMQEIFGALICGLMSNLQKAVLLYGGGNNGKSVMLDLIDHVFPPESKCVVAPEQMEKAKYRAELAGKAINIVGELEKSVAIKAKFKDVIGADTPITGRKLYCDPFYFTPSAGHIFASNDYPMTKDHSDGFYRRWATITFENTVPDGIRIPRLGAKIAEEEMAQILAWAVEGARRLVKQNFVLTETQQHIDFMHTWQHTGDSVFNFLSDDEVVIYQAGSCIKKTDFFEVYCEWCKRANVRAIGRTRFFERACLKLTETKIKGGARVYTDVAVIQAYPECDYREVVTNGDLVPYVKAYTPF